MHGAWRNFFNRQSSIALVARSRNPVDDSGRRERNTSGENIIKGGSNGIKQVIDTLNAYRNRQPTSAARSLEQYRSEMFVRGEEQGSDESGKPLRKGILRDQIAHTLQSGGKLAPGQALLTRIRYFTDGAVIGSKQSVDEVFNVERWRFGPKRSSGARKIRQIDAPGLCSLRDLQVDVMGSGVPPRGEPESS